MSDESFSHIDEHGRPRMVDIGEKPVSRRRAVAEGIIVMDTATLSAIQDGRTAKGNVLVVAEIAGITAAKQTAQLIPLCHPLSLSAVSVRLDPAPEVPGVRVTASVEAIDRTGVEMEALTAVTGSLLTIYDMCKAMDRGMRIEAVRLLRKEGGRSGTWSAEGEDDE